MSLQSTPVVIVSLRLGHTGQISSKLQHPSIMCSESSEMGKTMLSLIRIVLSFFSILSAMMVSLSQWSYADLEGF